MDKVRFISLLALGLLLSNLLLVGYMLVNKRGGPPDREGQPPPPGHRGPRNLIIERLHFSDAQVAEYDKLITWHRNGIDAADEKIIELKNRLYSSLTGPADSAIKDSLIMAISATQQEIERIHYKHFEDIRNLCTEQQKPGFEALTKEIASLFAPPPHKRH